MPKGQPRVLGRRLARAECMAGQGIFVGRKRQSAWVVRLVRSKGGVEGKVVGLG